MRIRTLCLPLVLALALALSLPAMAQDAPSTRPATQPGQQAPQRELMMIMRDLQAVQMELASVMSNPSVLTDPEARDAAAPKAIPALKRTAALLEEAATAAPEPGMAEQMRGGTYEVRALLVGLGDAEAERELKAEDSLRSKVALQLGAFIAANDEPARRAAVDGLGQIADQNPEDASIASAAMALMSLASDEQTKAAARSIVTDKLKGPAADQMKQALGQIEKQQQDEAAAAKAFEEKFIGKPLAIEGKTLAGETFSTAQWKGKVVLVDFWATWCAPCIAALPKVKQDYKQYHDQGFEIVGVSLDHSAEPLKVFLANNPDMPWPQIYTEADPSASGKVADGLGIRSIPTVFLLDKNGVVRGMAVGGGEKMDKLHDLIPELLKEEAK